MRGNRPSIESWQQSEEIKVGKLCAIPLKLAAVASLQILSRSDYEILASTEERSNLLVEQPQRQQKQDHHGYGPRIAEEQIA